MDYILYVCDTETTGQDPQKHDVIEVSFWRIDSKILSGEKIELNEQKTWYLTPLNSQAIEEKALYINKHKREDILHQTTEGRELYKNPHETIDEIEAWIMDDDVSLDDRVFIGQNPKFDYDFLVELWKKTGNENSFPFSPFILDTIQIARMIDVCMGKKRSRYNLGSLVKDFGVTKARAHRAADDTKMTKDLVVKQLSPIYNIIREHFKDYYTE